MNSNFNEMTLKELRAYMLAHRDDNEAFYTYMDRSRIEENWVTMPPLKSIADLDNYPDWKKFVKTEKDEHKNNSSRNENSKAFNDSYLVAGWLRL